MANPTVRVLTDQGEEVFNSWTDDVLFFIEERYLDGSQYGSGGQVVFSYPAYAGRKISAYVTLYQYSTLDAKLIPSCRVTYPNNVPTITVFLDNSRRDIPVAPAMLSVLFSGITQ